MECFIKFEWKICKIKFYLIDNVSSSYTVGYALILEIEG